MPRAAFAVRVADAGELGITHSSARRRKPRAAPAAVLVPADRRVTTSAPVAARAELHGDASLQRAETSMATIPVR